LQERIEPERFLEIPFTLPKNIAGIKFNPPIIRGIVAAMPRVNAKANAG
jgi:hypothetical protein